MDYETLYFELLEDVQNFEKSVQKQMEELISLNLYRRARMVMQEMVSRAKSAGAVRSNAQTSCATLLSPQGTLSCPSGNSPCVAPAERKPHV